VLTALVLAGIAFGCVEAGVVLCLRSAYEKLHQQDYPQRQTGDLLPLVPLERLQAEGLSLTPQPATEYVREAATLLLLAAIALAVGRNVRQGLAAFVFVFGVWDLSYYAFLKAYLDWPSSLFTWDILFLLPVPWVAPVLAPCLAAAVMAIAGVLVLAREAAGRPVRAAWYHWLGMAAGGVLVVLAFCWDHENISAGGTPNPFHWPLFGLGLGLGVAAFGHALRRVVN
jgi:hypothetical protein